MMDEQAQAQQCEDECRHGQRLVLVGRLAVGVAHDINNLLVVILGNTELLAARRAGDDPESALLDELREAGNRAAALARQILAFSRKRVIAPRNVRVNAILEQLVTLLHRLLDVDIELRLLLDPQVAPVRVDPGHFEQAIINLVVNARDAMPDGGLLAIETRQEGAHVAVVVRDTGHGIDPVTRQRIFEPFFTTKAPDKGTGLGLAMVRDFAEESGGHIAVESAVGAGAAFTISLPAVWAAVEPITGGAVDVARGCETVLVIDDDGGVRRVAARVLRSRGYEVLEARDGWEAMALIAAGDVRVDLVLADVMLPHRGGADVLRAIARIRPGVRAISMSGHAEAWARVDGAGFLEKPFRPDELARAVREALDRPR